MNELENKLAIVTKAIDDKKGIDMKVIDISDLTPMADYFVIVSGNSSAQVKSIADEVDDKMSLAGHERTSNIEGYQSARWILIDYGDIIVHIFHKDEREFYNLEKLWSHSSAHRNNE